MRRLALVVLLVALAGCVETLARVERPDPSWDPHACAYSWSYDAPGLYDALANASAGDFKHEQWAPSLPYENETLRARWRDYSLVDVRRAYGRIADVDTIVSLRRHGEAYEVGAGAEANATEAIVRDATSAFLRDVSRGYEEDIAQWTDALLATKGPSAWRDGIPGNATPHGEGPFREYEEGPIYAHSYAIDIETELRLAELFASMPPFDAWREGEAETSRHILTHDAWTVWFQEPSNLLVLDDVRISSIPSGASGVMVERRNATEALETLRDAYARAGLPVPAVEASQLFPMPCGD